jgi:hypothetical protein
MAWACIGYNYKSALYFVLYEGEGKGFTQQKYAEQILKGPLREIFEQPGDFFCIEDNSNVYGKTDTKKNRGLCNAVRLECYIYSRLGDACKSLELSTYLCHRSKWSCTRFAEGTRGEEVPKDQLY